MFAGSVLNRALSLRCPQILYLKRDAAVRSLSQPGKTFLEHGFSILSVVIRSVRHRLVVVVDIGATLGQMFAVDSHVAAKHDSIFPMAFVVDRHMPVHRIPKPTAESSRERG